MPTRIGKVHHQSFSYCVTDDADFIEYAVHLPSASLEDVGIILKEMHRCQLLRHRLAARPKVVSLRQKPVKAVLPFHRRKRSA